MSQVIYSIPMSGSRFVSDFFSYCGVYMTIQHTNEENPPRARSVIPLRHPYQVYDSWVARNWLRTVPHFLEQWRLIRERPKIVQCFYFPVEAKSKDREMVMRGAARFIGARYRSGFSWLPIGMNPKRDRSKKPHCAVAHRLAELVEWYNAEVVEVFSKPG